jgi:ABC-type phosphate transport system substrate-binding protein
MKRLLLTGLTMLCCCQTAAAEGFGIAVVINPENDTQGLTERYIRRIFLSKNKTFPDGSPAAPVVQLGSAEMQQFNSRLMHKSEAELRDYWVKILFTGGGRPPKRLASDEEVKQEVAANINAIGYIQADQVDDKVRVVLEL